MAWIKQGRIFHLEPSPGRSMHTQVPTPYVMEDRIRVYYSCRNKGCSFPAFFDLDRKDLKTVLQVHEHPIMELGDPGMFDSDGIMPGCVVENQGELWMYYTGWNEKTKTARYHNAIGVAVSRDGGETFQRKFDGPIVDRTFSEPGLAVTPFVRIEGSGLHRFSMWYISGVSWNKIGGQYEPVYVIKYAYSWDGINWRRDPDQCVESLSAMEAFSHPSVLRTKEGYRIWYCYRGSVDYRGGAGSYRIGYAEPVMNGDSIHFERKDHEVGINFGAEGEFDSHMQCYPYVIELDGRRLMFYNGNDFGQTGVGYAEWK